MGSYFPLKDNIKVLSFNQFRELSKPTANVLSSFHIKSTKVWGCLLAYVCSQRFHSSLQRMGAEESHRPREALLRLRQVLNGVLPSGVKSGICHL